MPTTNQPIYAEIVDKQELATIARIALFDKKDLITVFRGAKHQDDACAWVNEWNGYLDAQWLRVRETAAAIMQNLVQALHDRGVDTTITDAAMEDVKQRAQS